MFSGSDMAERRRVMRKWVWGSLDDASGAAAVASVRDKSLEVEAEPDAHERKEAAENMVGDDERVLVTVLDSAKGQVFGHVTFAFTPALNPSRRSPCRHPFQPPTCPSTRARSSSSLVTLDILSYVLLSIFPSTRDPSQFRRSTCIPHETSNQDGY